MNWLYNFLSENTVQALGWTVIHSLWQGILIACLMALAMMALQNKSANVRYWVAISAFFSMLFSAIVTFFLSLRQSNAGDTGDDAGTLVILRGLSENIGSETFGDRLALFFNAHLPLIVVVWMLGVAFFSLRLMGGFLYIHRLRNRHLVPLSSAWQARLAMFRNRLGIQQTVELAESALVSVPMVLGWLKPIILLPVGTVNAMSVSQVEAVLVHELAHIAGRDYLLNIVQSMVEIIFYYHPAVWWISANVRAERENRCDDIAVRHCDNSLTYAKALLSLQEMQHQNTARTYGLALTFSGQKKGFLLKRIKRILNQPQNRSNVMEKFTATGLLLLVVTALSFSSNQANKSPQGDTTPSVTDSLIATDSFPRRSMTATIVENRDGKEVELSIKDNKITNLVVDGKKIPKEEFGKYQELTTDILSGMPPAPPKPPRPMEPGMPPAPPAPPAPPRIGFYGDVDDDQRIIRLEKESKIVIKDGEIYINGEKMDKNNKDMAIDIQELRRRERDFDGDFRFFEFPESNTSFRMQKPRPFVVEGDSIKWFQGDSARTIHIFPQGRVESREFYNNSRRLAEDARRQAQRYRELNVEQLRRNAERLRENAERMERNYNFSYRNGGDNNAPQRSIESELKRDGFIKGDKKQYKFELSNKKLKINGKEMPDETHQKYLSIYKRTVDGKLDGNFKVVIEVDDND